MLKWISIILKIIPIIEDIYPHIITAIEVIREERKEGYRPGTAKQEQVRSKIKRNKKIVSSDTMINRAIDHTVDALKSYGRV